MKISFCQRIFVCYKCFSTKQMLNGDQATCQRQVTIKKNDMVKKPYTHWNDDLPCFGLNATKRKKQIVKKKEDDFIVLHQTCFFRSPELEPVPLTKNLLRRQRKLLKKNQHSKFEAEIRHHTCLLQIIAKGKLHPLLIRPRRITYIGNF